MSAAPPPVIHKGILEQACLARQERAKKEAEMSGSPQPDLIGELRERTKEILGVDLGMKPIHTPQARYPYCFIDRVCFGLINTGPGTRGLGYRIDFESKSLTHGQYTKERWSGPIRSLDHLAEMAERDRPDQSEERYPE